MRCLAPDPNLNYAVEHRLSPLRSPIWNATSQLVTLFCARVRRWASLGRALSKYDGVRIDVPQADGFPYKSTAEALQRLNGYSLAFTGMVPTTQQLAYDPSD